MTKATSLDVRAWGSREGAEMDRGIVRLSKYVPMAWDPETREAAHEYSTHRLLTCGDYDDSSMVERANIKALKEICIKHGIPVFPIWMGDDRTFGKLLDVGTRHKYPMLELRGDFGFSGIAVLQSCLDIPPERGFEVIRDIMQGLDNYPCIDEELLAKMERDAIEEYVDDSKDELYQDTIEALAKMTGRSLDELLTEVAVWEPYCYISGEKLAKALIQAIKEKRG